MVGVFGEPTLTDPRLTAVSRRSAGSTACCLQVPVNFMSWAVMLPTVLPSSPPLQTSRCRHVLPANANG